MNSQKKYSPPREEGLGEVIAVIAKASALNIIKKPEDITSSG